MDSFPSHGLASKNARAKPIGVSLLALRPLLSVVTSPSVGATSTAEAQNSGMGGGEVSP